MKRLLLAICLLSFSAAPVLAQNRADGMATQQVTSKLAFSSKINEFSASMSRKNAIYADKVLKDLDNMMSQAIQETDAKITHEKGNAKVVLEKAKQSQKTLLSEVKKMSPDPTKNQEAITEKLKAFQETL